MSITQLKDITGGKTAHHDYKEIDGNLFIADERENEIILHKVENSLRKIYLEPTSRCNLQCITCVRKQWADLSDSDMDLDLFYELLDQLSVFPRLEQIHLGGFGEPLAHPQALLIINELTKSGFRVSLNTNGTLVNEEVALALVNAGVHAIYFSIDGLKEETFRTIRVGGKLDQVVNNMLNLRKIKADNSKHFPKIGLEFVLMRSNIDQLPLLPRLAKEVGSPTVLISNLLPYSEEMYNEVLYDVPGYDRVIGAGSITPPAWNREQASLNLPEPVIWPAVDNDYVQWGSLRLPRMYWGSGRRCDFINDQSAVVRWDGSISPCYALMYSYSYKVDNRDKEVTEYLVGNIKEQNLENIWNNPEYVKFRHRVRNYNFPSCMDCSTNQVCDYANVNEDCWGNAPSCADCLWSQGIVRCP